MRYQRATVRPYDKIMLLKVLKLANACFYSKEGVIVD